jgi:hypothetical protein
VGFSGPAVTRASFRPSTNRLRQPVRKYRVGFVLPDAQLRTHAARTPPKQRCPLRATQPKRGAPQTTAPSGGAEDGIYAFCSGAGGGGEERGGLSGPTKTWIIHAALRGKFAAMRPAAASGFPRASVRSGDCHRIDR